MIAIRNILIAFVLLWSAPVEAASATIYFDNAGCESNSATLCSGTTDSASASAKGTGSTITCGATSGPAAAPGCIITGTQGASGQIASIAVDGSQALFVNCATNANQKLFFINSVDDTTGAVGVSGSPPTGCTAATSAWGIGGRLSANPIVSAIWEGAPRPGDTIQFNDAVPATRTTAYVTCRTAGTAAGGIITVQGKSGVRPKLEVTSGNISVIGCNQILWRFNNLEIKGTNTSLGAIAVSAAGTIIGNVLVSGCGSGGTGMTVTGGGSRAVNSEVHGCGIGISTNQSTSPVAFIGNYIHDNTVDGINSINAAGVLTILDNLIVNNGGRGIFFPAATTVGTNLNIVHGNTVALNTLAALEVTDADTMLAVRNNIFMNSNAANIVLWSAGSAELAGSSHSYNLFYSSGGGTLSGLTANSTELTSDPLFTNSGAADFTLQAGSPARNAGYPGQFLGSSLSYLAIGALQPQASAGGHVIGGGL